MHSSATEFESHTVTLGAHQLHYLAAGPVDGPVMIFVHGWPELSLSWRHQLPVMAGLGFRAIAPDMRGYGSSSVYSKHEDYAQEQVVGDLLGLLSALEVEQAVWVGHDWGSPTVWSIASHYPERVLGVASLCVPYYTLERGLEHCLELVDRQRYPEATYPAGQWEYMRYYEEQFDRATAVFAANPYNTVKLLFRKGDPAGFHAPSGTAMTRINNGWFGDASEAPDMPLDTDVLSEAELAIYAQSLERNGFFGPSSYYMNHAANAHYAQSAVNNAQLAMPVLFLAAQYDYTCETITSSFAEPMRQNCAQLDEEVVYSGHWMAQERPVDVNRALIRWLLKRLPELLPLSGESGL